MDKTASNVESLLQPNKQAAVAQIQPPKALGMHTAQYHFPTQHLVGRIWRLHHEHLAA